MIYEICIARLMNKESESDSRKSGKKIKTNEIEYYLFEILEATSKDFNTFLSLLSDNCTIFKFASFQISAPSFKRLLTLIKRLNIISFGLDDLAKNSKRIDKFTKFVEITIQFYDSTENDFNPQLLATILCNFISSCNLVSSLKTKINVFFELTSITNNKKIIKYLAKEVWSTNAIEFPLITNIIWNKIWRSTNPEIELNFQCIRYHLNLRFKIREIMLRHIPVVPLQDIIDRYIVSRHLTTAKNDEKFTPMLLI